MSLNLDPINCQILDPKYWTRGPRIYGFYYTKILQEMIESIWAVEYLEQAMFKFMMWEVQILKKYHCYRDEWQTWFPAFDEDVDRVRRYNSWITAATRLHGLRGTSLPMSMVKWVRTDESEKHLHEEWVKRTALLSDYWQFGREWTLERTRRILAGTTIFEVTGDSREPRVERRAGGRIRVEERVGGTWLMALRPFLSHGPRN